VTIDATKAAFIDHDILETLNDFSQTAPDDNVRVELIDVMVKHALKSIWAQV
jgi:hypothetical protein